MTTLGHGVSLPPHLYKKKHKKACPAYFLSLLLLLLLRTQHRSQTHLSGNTLHTPRSIHKNLERRTPLLLTPHTKNSYVTPKKTPHFTRSFITHHSEFRGAGGFGADNAEPLPLATPPAATPLLLLLLLLLLPPPPPLPLNGTATGARGNRDPATTGRGTSAATLTLDTEPGGDR